jgi:hypothetical protein
MYFYQKNFIYDVSSYSKTKSTTNNSITISNINISDLSYYLNSATKPQILLSTGNFSPWGAKDVLLADNWTISSTGSNFNLTLYISDNDITNYDLNQIKYLIFLDNIYFLQISSSDENFNELRLKNNTILRVKFNDNTLKNYYLTENTTLKKTSSFIQISCNDSYRFFSLTYNFNTNALQEINLSTNGFDNFPHFINFKITRPTNSVVRVLRVSLKLIDRFNVTYTLQTYYFSSFSGQTLDTFSLIPLCSYFSYDLNSASSLRLELAWTSDGNTLTTENTTIEVQCACFLPTNNFNIFF